MMNINGKLPTSEEEQAFLVYHICHGFQQLDVLKKFNEKFSRDLKTRRLENFLKKFDDESRLELLTAAAEYDWFNKDLPQNYDISLPGIVALSSCYWPMEQRAYILYFQARGVTTQKTLDNFNNRYRPQRTMQVLNSELTYLESNPELVSRLRSESHNFDWWQPAPGEGDKGWNAMDRRNRRVEAMGRKKAHLISFREFEQRALAAAARGENFGDIDGVEGHGELSFLSASPPPTSSMIPSSSHQSQSSQPVFRTPSPSAFLLSSPAAGVLTSRRTASASSALKSHTTPGVSLPNYHHGDPDNDEEEDSFSKPFLSPDGPTTSFPNLTPTSRRFSGPQLSYGSPLPSLLPTQTGGVSTQSPRTSSSTYLSPYHGSNLPSASLLAPQTGGISTQSPRTSSSTYLSPYHGSNLPSASLLAPQTGGSSMQSRRTGSSTYLSPAASTPSTSAPGSSQPSIKKAGMILDDLDPSELHDFYNAPHSSRCPYTFSYHGSEPSPLPPYSHGLPMRFSAPNNSAPHPFSAGRPAESNLRTTPQTRGSSSSQRPFPPLSFSSKNPIQEPGS